MKPFVPALLLTACASLVSPSSGVTVVSKDWQARFLKSANELRAKHCAQPLVWNETLAELGQIWAEKLASGEVKGHGGGGGGFQNLFQSKKPEDCGKGGYTEIIRFYNQAAGYKFLDWGHFSNHVNRALGQVAMGWAQGVKGTFCVENLGWTAGDKTKYGEPSVYPNTCGLAQPSCAVTPANRRDCTWGYAAWGKEDCERISCCYDATAKPNCFYAVEDKVAKAKRCGIPDFAKGEEVVYSDPIGPPFKPGTTVTLNCPFDKNTPGLVQPTSTCQKSGTWTPLTTKCPHFCNGPKNKRISPKVPYDPVAKWTQYFCTDKGNKDKFCYDAETNSCFYPFTDKPQCGKPEDAKIAGREQFQVIVGDVILPPQFSDKNIFPYPTGTVANIYCPDPTVKSTITCKANGIWSAIAPACPYVCKGPVEKRIAPKPDWQPPMIDWCIGHGSYNCWDSALKKCYQPFRSGGLDEFRKK